jgi:hypothetical protein
MLIVNQQNQNTWRDVVKSPDEIFTASENKTRM